MSTTLAVTSFLLGLAGGPHCAAMCGAACGAITRGGDADGGAQPIALPVTRSTALRRAIAFQAGRLAGYSAAGAAAAAAVENLVWFTSNTAALRPVWTLFHLAVLAWGLALVAFARQPAWAGSAGRMAWARVRPLVSRPGGILAAGALWAFMPCGLLYSALLVASLSGGALDGALSMALFALGGALSLSLAPVLFVRLRAGGNRLGQEWGTRAAGLILVLVALWALGGDMSHRIAQWCGLA